MREFKIFRAFAWVIILGILLQIFGVFYAYRENLEMKKEVLRLEIENLNLNNQMKNSEIKSLKEKEI